MGAHLEAGAVEGELALPAVGADALADRAREDPAPGLDLHGRRLDAAGVGGQGDEDDGEGEAPHGADYRTRRGLTGGPPRGIGVGDDVLEHTPRRAPRPPPRATTPHSPPDQRRRHQPDRQRHPRSRRLAGDGPVPRRGRGDGRPRRGPGPQHRHARSPARRGDGARRAARPRARRPRRPRSRRRRRHRAAHRRRPPPPRRGPPDAGARQPRRAPRPRRRRGARPRR